MIKIKIGQQVEFLASEIGEKQIWLVGTISKKYITRESGKPRIEVAVKTELGEWLMSPHNCRHLTKRAPDGAKRAAKSGSISGKRSVGSPRR